jgi:hypothetical protein
MCVWATDAPTAPVPGSDWVKEDSGMPAHSKRIQYDWSLSSVKETGALTARHTLLIHDVIGLLKTGNAFLIIGWHSASG